MLIDLSLKPIVVQPEECPRHVVVRTRETPQTMASVNRRRVGSAKNFLEALTPGVRLTRGRQTLMETRLDILYPQGLQAIGEEARYAEAPTKGPLILTDPYEIPTAYQDLLTHYIGSWRVQVQIQRRHTGTWLVTVHLMDQTPTLAIAAKDLWVGTGTPKSCEFPLTRHKEAIIEGRRESAWDRLTLEDD